MGISRLYRISFLVPVVFVVLFLQVGYAQSKIYVGSDVCKDCHEEEYKKFFTYSKMARSFDAIKLMKKYLTKDELSRCYGCHTTGYGRGGFISEEKTPQLKNTGCEACHGPGSAHVESQDPQDVKGNLTEEDCAHCHEGERVKVFKFRPMIYGGVH